MFLIYRIRDIPLHAFDGVSLLRTGPSGVTILSVCIDVELPFMLIC
jgi:hypothetical protein